VLRTGAFDGGGTGVVFDEHGPSDEVVATWAEAALLRRFPGHSADDVRLAVQHALQALGAVRVRTYLPVLVERAAVERLAAAGREASEAALPPPARAADVAVGFAFQ
jgi:hypothetical protein